MAANSDTGIPGPRAKRWKRNYAITLACLTVVAVIVTGCGSATRPPERAPIVMREYQGWTIRVAPLFSHSMNSWRARVQVWPPERDHRTQAGIVLRSPDTGGDREAVVRSALESARRYIDASRPAHQ